MKKLIIILSLGLGVAHADLATTMEQQKTNPSPSIAVTFGILDVNPYQEDLGTSQPTDADKAFSNNQALKDKIMKLKSASNFVKYCSKNLKVKYSDNAKYCSKAAIILAYDKYIINGFQMQVDAASFLKSVPVTNNKVSIQYAKLLDSFNIELDSLFNRTSISPQRLRN